MPSPGIFSVSKLLVVIHAKASSTTTVATQNAAKMRQKRRRIMSLFPYPPDQRARIRERMASDWHCAKGWLDAELLGQPLSLLERSFATARTRLTPVLRAGGTGIRCGGSW